ncbi:MAG TPA: redox-regulated ATPase YchF [Candidatus Dormibacteraeota bacterium]|nr:redox-regulated ATPase YchF [Candidatus Dormibacteraeota bacterium]
MQVGIVGKPNAGKSTFFSAATLTVVSIANYPFTTIKPNRGVSYLRTKCVCKELGVQDSPKNSRCIDGERFIPVELVDCPGLVPGASTGKGLGNQFLDDLRKADALVHVVDASGETDSEGKPASGHDPLEDVRWLERELEAWIFNILYKDWEKVSRKPNLAIDEAVQMVADRVSGLGLKKHQVEESLRMAGLKEKPAQWSRDDLVKLVGHMRRSAKPMMLAANKIDLPSSKENVERLRKIAGLTVAVSAEAELALRRAAEKNLISYKPGDSDFSLNSGALLRSGQKAALEMIRKQVLVPEGGTGVQECINSAFFKLLNMIVVYPVEDPERLADHSGNLLPDAILVQNGSTLKDLALKIHTDLGEHLLYGINARNHMRLGESYVLNNGDIVSIVSAS